MVAAAMAGAAALGTLLLPSNTSTRSIPRPQPNRNPPSASSAGAICPTSSAVLVLRDPTLRSLGNSQNLSTRWNFGYPLGEQLGRKKLSTKKCGVGYPLGEQLGLKKLSTKKCGVAVVASGQQQAARDRVVDFGKNKGVMMGTLSSKYLRWMVKNLKAGPLSEWSEYAEEVLADPYYKDRLEWEKVEKLMTEAHDVGSMTGNRDVVLAPAKMYGWDLQDDVGWRKVNFSWIGTTKGGRIPRVKIIVPSVVPQKQKPAAPRKKSMPVRTAVTSTSNPSPFSSSSSSASAVDDSSSSGSLRDELMRRRAQRRERLMSNHRGLLGGYDEAKEAQRVLKSKFPGRDSLLSTVRSYDISE